MRAKRHFGELTAQQYKMHAEANHLTHQETERKRMRNAHKVERNRSSRSKSHRQEGIHKHCILRAAISFGSGTENVRTHIEQERQRIPRKFLGNVGRKRTYKNHRGAKNCNSSRNPEGFHNTVVTGTTLQAILWQIPIQALIEAECCRMRNRQKERLRRDKDSKFGGAKNTRHHKSQKRSANLEDCPHHVYDHRLL